MVNKYIKNLFILACHNRNTDEDLSKFANYTAKKKKKDYSFKTIKYYQRF